MCSISVELYFIPSFKKRIVTEKNLVYYRLQMTIQSLNLLSENENVTLCTEMHSIDNTDKNSDELTSCTKLN